MHHLGATASLAAQGQSSSANLGCCQARHSLNMQPLSLCLASFRSQRTRRAVSSQGGSNGNRQGWGLEWSCLIGTTWLPVALAGLTSMTVDDGPFVEMSFLSLGSLSSGASSASLLQWGVWHLSLLSIPHTTFNLVFYFDVLLKPLLVRVLRASIFLKLNPALHLFYSLKQEPRTV
jgi:hypothetical protein